MIVKPNLSSLDRIARAVVGVVCVYLGFINQALTINDTLNLLIGLFGIINLFAAVFSYCPVYKMAGIDTSKSGSQQQADTD